MAKILSLCFFIGFLGAMALIQSCKKNETIEPEDPKVVHYQSFTGMTLSINANPKAPSYYLHKAGTGQSNQPCRISKSDLNGTSILCWLEGEELDLYYNGFSLNLQIPYGVCEYTEYRPFSFYSYKPGGGTINFANFSNTDGCSQCDYSNFSSLCSSCFLTIPPLNLCTAGYTTLPLFSFDYTSVNGPNCDVSVYYSKSYSFADASADVTVPTPLCSSIQYSSDSVSTGGGSYSNCLGGPITEVKVPFVLYSTIEGAEKTFEVKAPYALGFQTTMYLSNYLLQCAETASGAQSYDSKDIVNNTMEYASLNTTVTSSGLTSLIDPMKSSNPFYTWTCYNSAKDVLGRIYLQVRSWDVSFTKSDGLDELDPQKMNVSADEGTWETDPSHDYTKWDDLWGTGTTCSTTPGNAALSFPASGL